MTRKTTAQWRREVPTYDRIVRAVEHLISHWPVAGPMPRTIAHIHPDTRVVSVVLDGTAEECVLADQLLAEFGYRPGWKRDGTSGYPIWRKVVAS